MAARAPDSNLGLEGGDVLLVLGVGGLGLRKQALELKGRKLCVDTSAVLDRLGTDTEAKSGEGFCLVIGRWRAVDDKGCS